MTDAAVASGRCKGVGEEIVDRARDRRLVAARAPGPPSRLAAAGGAQARTKPCEAPPPCRLPSLRRSSTWRRSSPISARRRTPGFASRARSSSTPRPCRIPKPWRAKIGDDILAYLRTVSLQQLEGPIGLENIRQDLNERAAMRSGGKVREFVIRTLVVQ